MPNPTLAGDNRVRAADEVFCIDAIHTTEIGLVDARLVCDDISKPFAPLLLPVRKPNRPATVATDNTADEPSSPFSPCASPCAIPESAITPARTRKSAIVSTAL